MCVMSYMCTQTLWGRLTHICIINTSYYLKLTQKLKLKKNKKKKKKKYYANTVTHNACFPHFFCCQKLHQWKTINIVSVWHMSRHSVNGIFFLIRIQLILAATNQYISGQIIPEVFKSIPMSTIWKILQYVSL